MAAGLCRVSRSANEVEVLAAKAARGAGAGPAQAAQFGAAAVRHLAQGRDIAALDAALDALPAGPILHVPLDIARIAEGARARGVLADAQSPLAQSYVEALRWHAVLAADGTLTLDLGRPAVRCALPRFDLPQDVAARWEALAARLLVPESAASRLKGAGAGLSDND